MPVAVVAKVVMAVAVMAVVVAVMPGIVRVMAVVVSGIVVRCVSVKAHRKKTLGVGRIAVKGSCPLIGSACRIARGARLSERTGSGPNSSGANFRRPR
jgi:hypothetical protein